MTPELTQALAALREEVDAVIVGALVARLGGAVDLTCAEVERARRLVLHRLADDGDGVLIRLRVQARPAGVKAYYE